ncbi:MAG TPA: hypothetical protein VFG09_00275 [Thermodesulfovibrionales bacterium]|jgi:hypothetical protein|nr:hypothetical protein [Thermodesulfovibrionales bacterium]
MVKSEKTIERVDELQTWEEESGLLDFLSKVSEGVKEFDRTFAFGLTYLITPPGEIDGSTAPTGNIGFVVVRDNTMLTGRAYCLYTMLSGKILSGYIGLYSDGKIETHRELKPLKDFTQGKATLYDWLRELIKASCDKSF